MTLPKNRPLVPTKFLCLVALCVPMHLYGAWEKLKSLQASGASISALVVDLNNGKIIAQHEADKKLTPASLTKLVIGAAALDKFGSNHTFTTKIFATNTWKNGLLNGDLIIRGAGDPYLTNEMLWFLCSDVARAGIKEIRGNIVLDTSFFGKISKDSNRVAGQNKSNHAYDSPLSALAVNFSVLAAVVSPAHETNKQATVSLEPYSLDNIKIKNDVLTNSSKHQSKIQVVRSKVGQNDEIQVTGGISVGDFPIRVYRSISDADIYAGNVFKAFLEHSGVALKGKTIVNTEYIDTQNLNPVALVDGYPLDWQLRGLFKVSNNFIADMLTINLDGQNQNKSGATLEGGSEELLSFLKKTILDSKWKNLTKQENPILISGSGLTPENKMSSRDLVTVLDRMYFNTKDFPAFYSALPIPGSEGTVKNRFSEASELKWRDNIRAKTGTLTEPINAVGLAGYARTDGGKWLAFSIIVNGSTSKNSPGVEKIRDSIDSDLSSILSTNTL